MTCAHFFRGADPAAAYCTAGGERRHVERVSTLPGTDLALVLVNAPYDHLSGFPAFGPLPARGAPVVTFGFGAQARQPAARPGRLILPLPLSLSRTGETIVRPAALTLNAPSAAKGDSGGPVLHDARIIAIQSLILDPFGFNLGVATVNVVGEGDVGKLRALLGVGAIDEGLSRN